MLTEPDLELLEAYLDDTLTVGQVEEVADRLWHEPMLVAALDGLRAHRAVRALVWRAMQPSHASAQQLARKTVCSIHSSHRARFDHGRITSQAGLQAK